MRYEVGTLPKEVGGFVQPLGVHHNMETLYVAPSGWSILHVLGVVSEAHSNDVVFVE